MPLRSLSLFVVFSIYRLLSLLLSFKKMNQAFAKVDLKDVVRLPAGNVFVFLKPVRVFMGKSQLLSRFKYDDICYNISVPVTCSIGHLAKYLSEKFNVTPIERNSMWTFPFAVCTEIEGKEFSAIPKLIKLEQLKLIHTNCYDTTKNCFNLYYTHGCESDVTLVGGNPSSPIAVLKPSPASSSQASTSSTDSASDD